MFDKMIIQNVPIRERFVLFFIKIFMPYLSQRPMGYLFLCTLVFVFEKYLVLIKISHFENIFKLSRIFEIRNFYKITSIIFNFLKTNEH